MRGGALLILGKGHCHTTISELERKCKIPKIQKFKFKNIKAVCLGGDALLVSGKGHSMVHRHIWTRETTKYEPWENTIYEIQNSKYENTRNIQKDIGNTKYEMYCIAHKVGENWGR